ncbi:MAG: N-acetylmuramoyl-L-alanine amidase [Longimicrobiales bacterium]|nr:N-acetylmuramoyl-L-alanine amidase [Longimicrobiales bacterium]
MIRNFGTTGGRGAARVATVLLGAALAAHPAGLGAQDGTRPPPLHVEGVGEPVSVNVAMHRGYPAYPAWTLRSLGARVDGTARGARVVFGSDTLRFEAGSPFFRALGEDHQLVDAAYREGGIFYLPHQLYAEWFPETYPDQVSFVAGHLRIGTAADTAGPAAGRSGPPIVVIDPGHGGPDPGRVGPSGLKEKDVVLQVGKRLARELADRGYEVRLTRTTDTLIPLEQRAHMANEWRGSRPGLFLSIHANGVSDRRVTGFETFFLSDARTEDERRVAEMENASLAYESSSRVVGSDDLDLIMNTLRNDFYVRASHSLAGLVQDEFGDFHRGNDRGVKQAGFVVLIGAFMPAVLVELAFISNPAEERLLGSGTFQVDASEGIADAVDRFFEENRELWRGTEPGSS